MRKYLLALCAFLVPCMVQAAETVVFDDPTFAAYVDSSGNEASEDYLSIQGTDGTLPGVHQSYVMFDIGIIPDGAIVESAYFTVTVEEFETGDFYPYGALFHIGDDSWDDEIDWSTQSSGSIGTGFGSENMAAIGEITWDDLVAGGWNWQADLADSVISLLVSPEYAQSNNFVRFVDPVLTVTYNVVPVPGSAALAILGLSGVIAARRRKRNL